VAVAVAIMGVVAWYGAPPVAAWNEAVAWMRVSWLAALVLAAGGAYLVVAWLLGVDEVRQAPRWVRGRLFDAGAGGN